MKKILVIGSLNMDLVTQVPHLPENGETIFSTKFQRMPGGKGANQAVAAAKLKGNVSMIGKVGVDEYGEILLKSLTDSGVNISGVSQEGTTGMAFISVNPKGENHIVLVSGANSQIHISDIDKIKKEIEDSDVIVLQLEVPIEIVEHTMQLALEFNKKVILDPAPAQKLSNKILSSVNTLIPNETELSILTDMPTTNLEEIIIAAQHLKSLGVNRIIVTMGEKGSFLINNFEQIHIPSYPVKAVDTTAAGDAFAAAFTVGLTNGMTDIEAARFASKVASLVVTKEGAHPSLPTLEEVNELRFIN